MIKTKVIKTAEEYNLALSRIEKLMDAEPGTSEFDELELLSTLVDIYEEKHYPIDFPDPVEAIKFRMEQLGMNQQSLVPFIGSRSKVSEILGRKRHLTLPMIRALSKGLGIPSDVLLHDYNELQNDDELHLDYDRFPIKEMMKLGWIPKISDFEIRSQEIILDLIGDAGGMESVKCCLFRQGKSSRENEKNDTYALTAWCLKVLSIANQQSQTIRYVEGSVDAEFLREVAKLSYFENGPILAKEYLKKHGIRLIILEHLSKTYLDGAVFFPADKNPVIGLTLRYDRVDNFWFCLLHELAHLCKHSKTNGIGIIIDDLDLRKYENTKEDTVEKEADRIAQEALLPNKAWKDFGGSSSSTAGLIQIIKLANTLKVNPAIIAGRIRYETNNYKKFSNLLGHGQVRKQFSNN